MEQEIANVEAGGAIWQEDDRDRKVEDILGSAEYTYPPKTRLDIDEHNQGTLKETHYACTCYASYHAAELILQTLQQLRKRGNPVAGFRKQKEFGTFKEGVGDYVHTALKSIKQHGLILEDGTIIEIDSFLQVGRGFDADHDKIKYYISKGYGVVTSFSTRKSDNYKTTGYLSPSKNPVSGGHMVTICGYDDEKGEWIIMNSYGPRWGKFKDGTFRVKYEHTYMLQGMYIIFPKQNIPMIFPDYAENGDNAEDVKLMKELGVVKGTAEGKLEPHRQPTRLEVIIMMARLYRALKK